MGYSDGEALLLSRVQACDNFDEDNTCRGDWKILNSGKSDHYAILRPSTFDVEFITMSSYVTTYNTVIEVWQRYVDDAGTKTDLYSNVAALFDIMQWPKLKDTSTSDPILKTAYIRMGEDLEEMWLKDGGPQWLRWRITVTWQQQGDVIYAE